MCGRYSTLYELHAIETELHATWVGGEFVPRGNVSPTMLVPMVVGRPERRIGLARFGYSLPARPSDPRKPPFVLNARSETAATSPAFRESLRRRRCVVPIDGYYEWRLEGGKKAPYFVTSRDGRPMYLLGAYEVPRDPATHLPSPAFVLFTQAARGLPARVHDRMPFAFPSNDVAALDPWLDPSIVDGAELLVRALARPPAEVRVWPVDRAVSSSRAEGPALRDPIGPELRDEEGPDTPA